MCNGAMRFAQGGKPASRQAGLSTGLCQVAPVLSNYLIFLLSHDA